MEDFLITDPALASRVDPATTRAARDERLLVAEHAEGLDVSLFVHADILARLERDSPDMRLHPGNIPDFCTALEGVSHFICLTWNATHARSVSLMELEMLPARRSRRRARTLPVRIHCS